MLVMECSEELFSSDSLMQLFFFKQRAAYGMRISDWSSDVCSSDLPGQRIAEPAQPGPRQAAERGGEQVEQPGGETGHTGECSERMRSTRAGALNVTCGGNDSAKATLPTHPRTAPLRTPRTPTAPHTPHPPHTTPPPPPPTHNPP